ncbi:ECA1 [Symbiodinium pilosum]|uniref:P-type Ca(2+) transporter n=1 Tax=Symbiodinium pilosum TaxID=2952 RepID=A0A812U421_SYMPI|nr:ECA1 [Symbiodinium pilosum]
MHLVNPEQVAVEDDLRHPHTLPAEDVLAHFHVSLETGLTGSQVLQQRLRHGPNALAEEEKKSLWKLILAQFEDLLVRILLLSAMVSFFLALVDEKSEEGITAFVEPLVILLILIANAFVGVWQESNAEKALDALKRLQPDTAAVLRDGCWTTIDAVGLVPGDVVQVKVGDKVPADVRVVKLNSTTIRVEQSQLTGESQSVSKDPTACLPSETIIQSKVNMLFASTTISNGACIGVVTATGMSTEIGAIQDAVQLAAGEEEQTPLQQKLDDFGNLLAKVIFVICALVWMINYKHFFDPVHGSVIRGCIYYFKHLGFRLLQLVVADGMLDLRSPSLAPYCRKLACGASPADLTSGGRNLDLCSLNERGVAMLAFLVVFRTTQAYSRYWEGATRLKQVRGEWFGAASSLFAFCSRDPEKEDLSLAEVLVRLVSMLWATALEQLAGCDLGFEVLDISGLSSESVAYVRQQEDKCEVILQWIQTAVVNHIDSHVLDVPPPIITRVFQELSRGRVSLEQVQTIIDVSFPFPYAQMIAFALMANSIIMPVLCASAMDSEAWCWAITTISVTALWGVNYTAGELENPFNDDYNDLPLRDYCEEMNRSLARLLQPLVFQCPDFTPADFSIKSQNWGLANRTAVERDVMAKRATTAQRSQVTLRQRFLRSRKKKGQGSRSQTTVEQSSLLNMDAPSARRLPDDELSEAAEPAAEGSATSAESAVIGKPADEEAEPGGEAVNIKVEHSELPDAADAIVVEAVEAKHTPAPKAAQKKVLAVKKPGAEPKRKPADGSSSSKDHGPGGLSAEKRHVAAQQAQNMRIAIALAVAAIPEGLPAVITTCLALGTSEMAKKNAIVRRLPSVETLGCTSVICSDKTGTLTTNEMCCTRLVLPMSSLQMGTYVVEGHSYAPMGLVQGLAEVDWQKQSNLQAFAKIAAVCNDSRLEVEAGSFRRMGEPTEAALLTLVEKLGVPDPVLHGRCWQRPRDRGDAMAFCKYWTSSLLKKATLEFTRDRKSMSVFCAEASGGMLYVKGAPESILERCTSILLPNGSVETLSPAGRQAIRASFASLASEALRTLALAQRLSPEDLLTSQLLRDPANFVQVETDLTFVGLVGIIDPPRPECLRAIQECRLAGISVVMITGDNKGTAEAIARKLGILTGADSLAQKSFTGKDFESLADGDKVKVLQHIMTERDIEGAVFSRTEPKHKQMIVKILKQIGEIAAMTGDGVNDAPALKQADIGIAMGMTGTEVAKEAADMVLADDNFSTIVAAVEEGRSIYNNMKAFIRYLISSNIGEVVSIFLTAALGIPEGLAPVQLLWVNLVTDGLPATALGFNPPDLDVMYRPPRRADDGLISGWVFFRYMVIGIYVGIATVGIFVYWYCFDDGPDSHTLVSISELMTWNTCAEWPDFLPMPCLGLTFHGDPCSYFTTGKVKASTLSLTVLVIIEMLNAFNALSEDGSLLQMAPWTNPWLVLACLGSVMVHFVILYVPFLAKVFAVCPLDWHDWVLVMTFSFPVIVVDEILKFFGRQYQQDGDVSIKRD